MDFGNAGCRQAAKAGEVGGLKNGRRRRQGDTQPDDGRHQGQGYEARAADSARASSAGIPVSSPRRCSSGPTRSCFPQPQGRDFRERMLLARARLSAVQDAVHTPGFLGIQDRCKQGPRRIKSPTGRGVRLASCYHLGVCLVRTGPTRSRDAVGQAGALDRQGPAQA